MTAQSGGDLITPAAPEMRRVLGHFCTGIAVITAHDGDTSDRLHLPIGHLGVAGSALHLVLPVKDSSTSWPMIREVGTLCVNILAAEQKASAHSSPPEATTSSSGIDWNPGANGAPTLDGALGLGGGRYPVRVRGRRSH